MHKLVIKFVFITIFSSLGISACQQQDDPAEEGAAELTATSDTDSDIPQGPLPATVEPLAYQLELTIDPQKEKFSGRVSIELDLLNSTDRFYLHGKELEATRVELTIGSKTLPASYQQVDQSGTVRIDLPEAVQGRATLQIHYTAAFNQVLEGLYKVTESGADYAFTQFEAISARLAFPGFDEPRFKTPFDITLIVPETMIAISNTPVLTSKLENGMKTVHFATSKPLSTYLIAFAVGDFDVVTTEPLPATEIRTRELPLRGVAVKGKGEQLEYALAETNAIVTALERYFGTPYPWSKLDLIAVPDFAAGAMENAGAITYRDSLLLFDSNATAVRKRRFKMVHAHELAHQWFGDLVTPVWWNDIWLNESFATWMAFVSLDLAEPQANFRRDLLSRGLQVMGSDSLINARQIRQPIKSNNDIATAFDGITYSKGGAVLSMFESFLGRENFRQGVRNYMQEFEYGTATADDFIRYLAAASTSQPDEVVTVAFNSFLEQAGLPLLGFSSQCTTDGVSIQLKQSRYFPLGSSGDRNQQWSLPVCLRMGNAEQSSKNCLLLTEKEQTFQLPGQCPDWIIPNADSAGYYRYTLSKADWKKLLANSDEQNTEEMMAMLASLSGAFDSGDLDVATLMSIAPQMIASPDWQVATAPMGQMNFIYSRMASATQKTELEKRFREFYSTKLEETGLASTDDRDKARLQGALVRFLADTAKQPELRSQLVEMALAYTGYETDGEIHIDAANPNIIGTALGVAVDELGAAFIDHLQQLALASTDAVVRGRALAAIGSNRDPLLTAAILELISSPELRDNEIYNIFYPQAYGDKTREATWEWLQKNIEKLLLRMPEQRRGRIAGIGSTFCDQQKKTAVEAFFAERVKNLAGGPRSLAKGLESIDLCIAKVKYYKVEMEAWLGQ